MAAPTPRSWSRSPGMLADGTLHVPIQATTSSRGRPTRSHALAATHTQGKLAIRVG